MSVWIVAFTLRGANLAAYLGRTLPGARAFSMAKYAAQAGTEPVERLADWCRRAWEEAEGLVFVGAAGIAVRSIAPRLQSKTTDPAVVVVDEGGQFAISLASGHMGGANELTRQVAACLGATPVVTTATDVNGKFAVDVFAVKNGLAITSMRRAKEISAAILAGKPVGLHTELPLEGEVPPELTLGRVQEENVEIGFHARYPGSLLLIPRGIYLGLGCRRGTGMQELAAAVEAALAAHRIPRCAVAGAASIDLKADEPGLLAWAREEQLPLTFYTAEALRQAEGDFSPSEFVKTVTGVDNVCERAAVLAAGGGRLRIRKQAAHGVTVAAAEKVLVVGIGPGEYEQMTIRAASALREAQVIVGYTVYVDLVREHFPGKRFLTTPMTQEAERCQLAFQEAMEDQTVAMICSGDGGVYGMSGLIYEVGQGYPQVEIEVIPGVTAALSGGAVLGAPLIHDFAVISLSDLLTPWEKIEKRLLAAAEADFAICLYNPSSRKRKDYLRRACDLLLRFRNPETVCGTVRNIGRPGESAQVCTLAQLRELETDMFTTVFVGNSQTRELGGHMVTPRGYRL